MSTVLKALRSVRRELNIAMVLSIVLVCCIEFWWRHYPPLFGWSDASRFADVTVNLLLAYMASWIFFFVRDHWEMREDEAKRNAKIESAYLGLFNAAVHLYGMLQDSDENPTPKRWQFTETDDISFLTEIGDQGDSVAMMIGADIGVEGAYLQQRDHYHTLKISAEHLPPRTFVIVEDINQAFLDLFHADSEHSHLRSESRIKRKGDFGWKLNTLHLELFRLKNRLKRSDVIITLPELKELLENGHSWVTREDRGIPNPIPEGLVGVED